MIELDIDAIIVKIDLQIKRFKERIDKEESDILVEIYEWDVDALKNIRDAVIDLKNDIKRSKK
jgi:hypothetical protein